MIISSSAGFLVRSCGTNPTGKGAAINDEFVDMKVGVPRNTGADAAKAVWSLDGNPADHHDRSASRMTRPQGRETVTIEADLRIDVDGRGASLKGEGRRLDLHIGSTG